jgi:type IV secretory pathway component VirB8
MAGWSKLERENPRVALRILMLLSLLPGVAAAALALMVRLGTL